MSDSTNRQSPLANCDFMLPDSTLAIHYAATLLRSLGANTPSVTSPDGSDAALDWASSGLMPLTGYPSDAPLQGPGAIASCAKGVLSALRLLMGRELLPGIDGATLLSERAASLELTRQGATSPNGSCQLLKAADGYIALNLARSSDRELMPAWLECDDITNCWEKDVADSWEEIAQQVSQYPSGELVDRGRLMGLPVSQAVAPELQAPPWFTVVRQGQQRVEPAPDQPLVIDLSSLWAGPLCGHLLSSCGARVIKVESARRPDGARRGSPAFFDLLNSGKSSVALDLSTAQGQQQLQQLIEHADMVIEGSRPRALWQMGIDAEQLVATRPGLVWISITGYGREEPQTHWVAFGDDAAVAAGVATATHDPPLFCGDALADPLTGLHAALASVAFWRAGQGALLDLSLRNVTAHCLSFTPNQPKGTVLRKKGRWYVSINDQKVVVQMPKQRQAFGKAAPLGADTKRLLDEFKILC